MAANVSYCIMCGKEKDGIEIKEDHVIKSMRWFNRKVLRTGPRNNRIVICSEDYPKYKEQRRKYLSRQKVYAVLGLLFLIFGVIIAKTVGALLIGLAVLAALYLLSLLSYLPDLSYGPKQETAEPSRKHDHKTTSGKPKVK